MSTQHNDGGPEFPNQPIYSEQHGWTHPNAIGDSFSGLSLRDYFAAKALNGYLAGRNSTHVSSYRDEAAVACYDYADAMIRARGRGAKCQD